MCMYVHVRVGHTHTKGVCMYARAFVCMCARVCVHTPTNTIQTNLHKRLEKGVYVCARAFVCARVCAHAYKHNTNLHKHRV